MATTKFVQGQKVQSNYPHYGCTGEKMWKDCVIVEVLPDQICQSGTMYKAVWTKLPSPNPFSSPLDEAWFRA